MIGVLAVVIVGLVFGSISTVDAQCTEAKIRECAGPVISSAPSKFDSASLNTFCPKIQTATSCMSRNRCYDSDDRVKEAWIGAREAFGYICGAGRQIFTAKATCMASQGVVDGITSCNRNGQQTIQQATTHEAICRWGNSMVTCIRNAVSSKCGSDAGRAAATFMAKYVAPGLSVHLPSCTIATPSKMLVSRSVTEVAEDTADIVLNAIDKLF